MATAFTVPGVYYDQRPRSAEIPLVRTDIAGFIGFDPRVREAPDPAGSIRVDVSGIRIELNGVSGDLPPQQVTLAPAVAAIPLAVGESVGFSLAAIGSGTLTLATVKGSPATTGLEQVPSDGDIEAAVGIRLFVRIADVRVRRTAAATFLTSVPALRLTRCDDFRDFVLAFGLPIDDGMLLAPAVRAFFANGGRRCWISTIRRPNFVDAQELQRARDEMVGVAGSSERDATGLERLLQLTEVTFVD